MWKSKWVRWVAVVLTILTMLMATGCFNKPPTIASLTSSATNVARGGSCTVTCTASDLDADVLTYTWACTGGTISGTGSTVTWIAPIVEGTYTISVTASDGEESVSDSCNINVVNIPPIITSLIPSATNVAPSGSCTVNCAASDPDGDTLTYNWTSSGGAISGTGSTVTWIAPIVEGTYTISVTASDGEGGTDSDNCDITVEMQFGAINIQSTPAGAAVYLDGVDTGNITPYVITNIEPGSHTIMLAFYHYKYRQQTITVNAGETTYLNWSLTYAPELMLTIQPDATAGKDATVNATNPDTNWGTDTRLGAGRGAADTCRAYLQFSLDSLPAGAVITGANLGLYYWSSVAAVIAPIGVYTVQTAWSETGITWNNQPTFATISSYFVNVPAAATNAFIYWTITDIVQGWWNGIIPNYGVMLKDTDEGTIEAWKSFRSSDYGTASQRPVLVITYFDPTP